MIRNGINIATVAWREGVGPAIASLKSTVVDNGLVVNNGIFAPISVAAFFHWLPAVLGAIASGTVIAFNVVAIYDRFHKKKKDKPSA